MSPNNWQELLTALQSVTYPSGNAELHAESQNLKDVIQRAISQPMAGSDLNYAVDPIIFQGARLKHGFVRK
jgi:hypothetical protein